MKQSKFIVVSNRLPVTVSKENGKLVFTESSGGLATAMSSVNKSDMLWIGWPGIASEDLTSAEKATVSKELKKRNCVPVYLNESAIELFYEGYANDTLWPLFHYFQESAVYKQKYWHAYQSANEQFAKVVMRHTDPNATIWVHDYHFLLLPGILRAKCPSLLIGFFLHIPFPSHEIFRLLPERKEILEGMLGADVVGFHIYDYARHFLSSCLRMLGVESKYGMLDYSGRTILTDAFPIGIDYKKFTSAVASLPVKNETKKINAAYPGQKIIISVDRLDYTKGILHRLEAYGLFLEEHPSFRKKVVLIVVAVPSRTQVKAYRDLRDNVEQIIGRINGTFGTVDWTPISYQFKNLPFNEIVGLYNSADVAVVTPLRDGMNLVAKEYVASKQRSKGILVLSELAGAVDELPESVKVNPNSIKAVKSAIHEALTMSVREKSVRMKKMQQRLATYPVQKWATDFLNQLQQMREYQLQQQMNLVDTNIALQIKSDYTNSSRKLIILDYDGTVRDFVSSPLPASAKPSVTLMRLLKNLISEANTTVCIVSGRSKKALDSWFKDMPIILAAEHGAWVKYSNKWESTVSLDFDSYKKPIIKLLRSYDERTAGAEIEEKDYSIVWHYRNVATELAYIRNTNISRDLQALIIGTDIDVNYGEKIIEIKPSVVNKGAVLDMLVAKFKPDFILCAGDDYTDEDMFAVLPEFAYSIKVGQGYSNARYQVLGVRDMIKLLRFFIK